LSVPDRVALAERIGGVFVRSLSLDIDPRELPASSNLGELAGLDSLARLELVAGLEQEFGFEIEPEHLNQAFLGDLDAMVDYFAARLGGDWP